MILPVSNGSINAFCLEILVLPFKLSIFLSFWSIFEIYLSCLWMVWAIKSMVSEISNTSFLTSWVFSKTCLCLYYLTSSDSCSSYLFSWNTLSDYYNLLKILSCWALALAALTFLTDALWGGAFLIALNFLSVSSEFFLLNITLSKNSLFKFGFWFFYSR